MKRFIARYMLYIVFYAVMIIEEKMKDINMEDIMEIMIKTK